jgi:4'-phosphopantetheinyl transferase EntD
MMRPLAAHSVGGAAPAAMITCAGSDIGDAPNRIAAWITATTPQGTAVAVDRIGPSATFDAGEEAAIARAVASRRNEFTTGRRLAREALARLGCAATSLPADSDRVPRWPKGFVGTISHAGGLCIALVGCARDLVGIGVDIEATKRLQPGLTRLICRPDEIDLDETGDTVDPTLLRFVAKEAFYKAYFPTTRAFLGFQDVRVTVDPTSTRFEARLMQLTSPSLCGARAFMGSFATLGSHVVAVAWIAR